MSVPFTPTLPPGAYPTAGTPVPKPGATPAPGSSPWGEMQGPPAPFAPFGASGNPQPGFGFGAGAGAGDMHSILQLLQQSMQQQGQQGAARGQLANDVMFGRHLGIGGAPMTPGNPTGNPADPWGAGGLFHGGMGAQIGPEATARSNGSDAVNQWNQPKMFPGQAFQGPIPNAAQGQVLDPGMGQMQPNGMQNIMGQNGPASVYDPRFDRAEGRSGIESRYDPAFAGTKGNIGGEAPKLPANYDYGQFLGRGAQKRPLASQMFGRR